MFCLVAIAVTGAPITPESCSVAFLSHTTSNIQPSTHRPLTDHSPTIVTPRMLPGGWSQVRLPQVRVEPERRVVGQPPQLAAQHTGGRRLRGYRMYPAVCHVLKSRGECFVQHDMVAAA